MSAGSTVDNHPTEAPRAVPRYIRVATGLAVLAITAVVGWRVMVNGLADLFVALERPATALAWYPNHPEALYQQARALTEDNPTEARELLLRAAVANPGDARVYLALARLPEVPASRSRRLMELALEMAPMRSQVQQAAAAFWAEQGEAERSLQHLGRALTLVPELAAGFFPKLLTLAADPAGRASLGELLAEPPPWWPNFVDYAIANAADPRTAVFLYRQWETPETEQRERLLARLEADGYWQDAYFVWLNGLSERELESLGNVFDGEFELPLGGRGFGWRYDQIQGATVDALGTYGSPGKALRLSLDGSRFRFRHLLQVLLLPPGDYLLAGRVRPEGLKAREGVVWTVRCLRDGEELVRTDAFVGSSDWQRFSAPFKVGQDCRLQELRLQQAGEYIEEFRATGSIWFDDLSIQRYDPLAPRLAQ